MNNDNKLSPEKIKKMNHEQTQESNNEPSKNKKTNFLRNLKALATNVKLRLKKHFPRRIWPTKQANKKGSKF